LPGRLAQPGLPAMPGLSADPPSLQENFSLICEIYQGHHAADIETLEPIREALLAAKPAAFLAAAMLKFAPARAFYQMSF